MSFMTEYSRPSLVKINPVVLEKTDAEKKIHQPSWKQHQNVNSWIVTFFCRNITCALCSDELLNKIETHF